MKLNNLKIQRPEYGNDVGKLIGKVELRQDNDAKVEIVLTPGAISRIVAVIAAEVLASSREIPSQVKKAMETAQDEGVLLEHDGDLTKALGN